MATPILDKLSKDLSFKIFDPVSVGTYDGRVYSKELRLSYLNRAYGKLVRTLEVIHPKIVKVFKDYYKIVDLNESTVLSDSPGNTTTAGEGNTFELTFPFDVYDVYYYESIEDQANKVMRRADYLDPDNFLPTKLGLNDLYVATSDNRKWSLIDNKVILLPEGNNNKYYGVKLFCRNYFPEFNQDDASASDISIPNDYKDILITMAAIEAMSDRGMTAKYQLYTATLNTQLQLIAQDKANADIEERGQK